MRTYAFEVQLLCCPCQHIPMFMQPDIRPMSKPWWRPAYELVEEFTQAWIGTDRRQKSVVIPKGFKLDGSSEWLAWPLVLVGGALILKHLISSVMIFGLVMAGLALLLWLLGIGADGPQRAAAVVHDWLYENNLCTRKEADYAYYVICTMYGMTIWRAWPRWAVLRAVGWIPWHWPFKDKERAHSSNGRAAGF